MKPFIFLIISLFLYTDVKAGSQPILLINPCDTITKKEFLSLSETIYKKLDSINSFSDAEMKQAIKIYNSIFLVSSRKMKSKGYIKDFQKKFDLNYHLPLTNNSEEIVITKYSGIIFSKLGVLLLNNYLIYSGSFTCKDLFYIKGNSF